MCVCIGRKHRLVDTASFRLDAFKDPTAFAVSSMNDGYKFPCCQLKVPRVCYIGKLRVLQAIAMAEGGGKRRKNS